MPVAEDTFKVTVFECVPWNTTYSIHVNYTNNDPRITITKQEYLNQLNASTYEPPFKASDEMVSLYHALVDLIKGTLGGGLADPRLNVNTTLYNMPTLLAPWQPQPADWGYDPGKPLRTPRPDMLSAVEQLSHNISLSLLSQSNLIESKRVMVPCTISKIESVWEYRPRALLISYGAAIIAASGSLVVGAVCLYSSGLSVSPSFGSFLLTTRNPTLDRLAEGHSLGQIPLPKHIARTRLRFGEFKDDDPRKDGANHAAFGLPDEVMPIRRGVVYV